jgi:hypothetical protein
MYKLPWQKTQRGLNVTVIEIRPCRNGWQVYEGGHRLALDRGLDKRGIAPLRCYAVEVSKRTVARDNKGSAVRDFAGLILKHYSPRPDNMSEIAHQLGVANILEGSVQRAADQVHVNVQLVSATTDEHLWAESYDRKLENIFGVEAEVATAVAEALKAKLTGAEQHALEQKPTNNPQAYDAYLRGIALYGESNTLGELSKSTQPFEEAVRLDPNFAMAWAMLAWP